MDEDHSMLLLLTLALHCRPYVAQAAANDMQAAELLRRLDGVRADMEEAWQDPEMVAFVEHGDIAEVMRERPGEAGGSRN